MASPVATYIDAESSGDTGWTFSSASGADRTIVFVRFITNATAGDAETQTTAITATGLTFTRVVHEAFLMSGSGPYATVDIFTAPVLAATSISSLGWTATVTGDPTDKSANWTYIFSVAGLGDINNPFDPNTGSFKVASELTGSSSAPSITGFTTTNADDLLFNVIMNWGGLTSASATSGWTNSPLSYNPHSMGSGAGAIEAMQQFQSVSAAQSSVTITAPYSDNYWASIAFAFTADSGGVAIPGTPPPNTWASTETPDSMAVTIIGYPGVVADLEATEILDIMAAAGYPAAVGTMAIQETPDNFAARVIRPTTGTLAATERPDTFAAAGVGFGVNIAMNITELLDIAHFLVDAVQPTNGVLAATETPDRFQALGAGAVAPSSQQTVIFFVA